DLAGGAPPPADLHVVAYDFGIKRSILYQLRDAGCRATVVPATTTAKEALALGADGYFLSNGPGDPAAVESGIEAARGLADSGEVVFGICLGHQILSLAMGARTFKLPFGHHGGNHPVKDLATGKVEITSQNHNFAVDADTLGELGRTVRMTHVNLNDGVCEGLEVVGERCFGVQHHPEEIGRAHV